MNFQQAFYPSAAAHSLCQLRDASRCEPTGAYSAHRHFGNPEIIIKKTYKKKTNTSSLNKNASRDADKK